MWTVEEFRSFHEREIRPAMEILRGELSKARKTALKILLGGLALAGAAGLVAFVVSPNSALVAAAIPFVLGALVALGVWLYKSGQTNARYKSEVVKGVVKFIGPELNYLPEGHISLEAFQRSQIFTHSVDRFSGEDLVSGSYGKVQIEFSEIHAEYKTTHTDSKGHTHTSWHTIFKGVFFVADFNKDFKTGAVVVPDVAERALGALIGGFLQKMNFSRPGQLVKLEDPEFERSFAVYGEDQVEARYILTPALMARIMELKGKFGEGVALAFKGSKVHVAIPKTRNLFEMPSGASASFEDSKRLLLDLLSFVGIVEDLNLETRIWSKE